MKTLYELWLAFLNKLHLYTLGQHNKVCEMAADMYEIQIKSLQTANDAQTAAITAGDVKIKQLQDELKKITAERDEALAKYSDLELSFEPVVAERDALREQIAAYKDAAMENVTYVKDVQKQLSKVLQDSEPFGFPNSRAIPGSTSIRTIDAEQDGKSLVHVRGRTIIDDNLTAEINAIPDMGTRLRTIMKFMEKYGVFTKIARDMFSYGAVQCVLGYSEKCTNYELYYEIVANQANADSILVVRNPERQDETTDDKKDE